MRLIALCDRCGKKFYDTDVPKWRCILDREITKHQCRVRTRKRFTQYIRYKRVNNIKKFDRFR